MHCHSGASEQRSAEFVFCDLVLLPLCRGGPDKGDKNGSGGDAAAPEKADREDSWDDPCEDCNDDEDSCDEAL